MKLAATIILALAISPTAFAEALAEKNGFKHCQQQTQKLFDKEQGLKLNRTHLTSKTETNRTFFLNGYAWSNGDRIAVAVACTTNLGGRDVTSIEPIEGHFIPANGSPSQIAKN